MFHGFVITGLRSGRRLRRVASVCLLMLIVLDVGFTGSCDRHSIGHVNHSEAAVAKSSTQSQSNIADPTCCGECFCCSSYTVAALPVPVYAHQMTSVDVISPILSPAIEGPSIYHPPRSTVALHS
jgi:hypothetical protein